MQTFDQKCFVTAQVEPGNVCHVLSSQGNYALHAFQSCINYIGHVIIVVDHMHVITCFGNVWM